MATVKRTAIAGGYFIELGAKDIEIYRIATDGSGHLKRIDDTREAIRAIAEEYGFERDYDLSYRQYVSKLILHINGLDNTKKDI
jgi:hypothetical protein